MRFDKLTTKFQQAINDAQSIALGADNTAIDEEVLQISLAARKCRQPNPTGQTQFARQFGGNGRKNMRPRRAIDLLHITRLR